MTNKQILSFLKKHHKVALFAHENPDADACGSVFGFQELCKNFNVEADVFFDKREANFLDEIFPMNEAKDEFSASDYDLIVLLDVYQFDRVDINKKYLEELEKVKDVLIIDHHMVAENFVLPSKNFRIIKKASCCQLVADLFEEAELKISPVAATYLYAGLVGDTARFLHNNLSEEVFDCAKMLQKAGADIQKVYNFMFRYKTLSQIRVNKLYLKSLKFLCNGQFAYWIVTQKDLKKNHANYDDFKTFANEMTNIKGVNIGFFCFEVRKNYYKFALRCLDSFNVNKFCVKHDGGGHVCASGFRKEITKKQLKKMLPIWAEEIVNDK